jgi:hypothetical protein
MIRYLIKYSSKTTCEEAEKFLKGRGINNYNSYLYHAGLSVLGATFPEDLRAKVEEIGRLEGFDVLEDPIPNGKVSGNSHRGTLPHLLVPKI